jgi:hypothetical protein
VKLANTFPDSHSSTLQVRVVCLFPSLDLLAKFFSLAIPGLVTFMNSILSEGPESVQSPVVFLNLRVGDDPALMDSQGNGSQLVVASGVCSEVDSPHCPTMFALL